MTSFLLIMEDSDSLEIVHVDVLFVCRGNRLDHENFGASKSHVFLGVLFLGQKNWRPGANKLARWCSGGREGLVLAHDLTRV